MPTAPSVTRYKGEMTKWPTRKELAGSLISEHTLVPITFKREDQEYTTRFHVKVVGMEQETKDSFLVKVRPVGTLAAIDPFVLWFTAETNHITIATHG